MITVIGTTLKLEFVFAYHLHIIYITSLNLDRRQLMKKSSAKLEYLRPALANVSERV